MLNLKIQDQGKTLANFIRRDMLHLAKDISESKLKKLLDGLAIQIGIFEGILEEVQTNFDIRNTTNFISEWEEALGIPDGIFKNTGTLSERRKNVLVKLASLGISTKEEFEYLASLYALDVEILPVPGVEEIAFPAAFPVSFFGRNPKWGLIIKVNSSNNSSNFPYSFPFFLGSNENLIIIKKLFQILVGSNIYVILKQTG